jgi:hypothetical protein
MLTLPDTIDAVTTNYNTAASGGDSVVTLNAATGNYHVLDWVVWSYAADPTTGALTITDTTANTVLLSVDVTVGGPGEIVFGDRGFRAPKSAALEVKLVDGSQTKKLTVQSR